MVRIAEASGTLPAVLERIAAARQRAEKLRGKVLSASLYPALLITVAIGAVTVMLVFVVPRFKEMISQAGNEPPAPARAVFAASDWLIANGVALGRRALRRRDRPESSPSAIRRCANGWRRRCSGCR